MAWGEEVFYTLTPAEGTNNGYAANCDVEINGITWNVTGNAQMLPWRLGGKSISEVDREVYSKTPMGSSISKVELEVGEASSITVNSIKLIVASDDKFNSTLDEVTATFVANSTITIEPTNGTSWAEDSYYKFIFNVTVSGSKNKFVEFKGAKFYSETSSTLDESDLTITGAPVELSFDLYNNKEAQTVNFTTSSTGAVTVSESEYVTTSVSGNSITVTPVKVTPSTQTITVSQAADETYAAGTVTFTVTITDSSTPIVATNWQKTSLADLSANDVFVIVGNNGSNFALSNDKGTSSAPSAVEVTVSGDCLTGDIADNIKWNVSGNATEGYTFYPNGSTDTWLYCTNSNNGVRVGDNSNKTFKVVDDYLQHVGTSRYVGIYNSSDWRCYTSINVNIEKQTFAFYKYVGAPVPSITAKDVEIAYNATSGSISYTVENGVDGGTMAATTEADWLTMGDASTTAVAFTATQNETALTRTAEVVLTYTYGTATTSKTITVTQTGNPNASGSENNPYTVAEALEVIEALADNEKTSDVYVKGTISSITEVSVYDAAENTGYGNATYFISDGTNELEVFRGYFLENAKFTSMEQIQAGDVVVVYGQLQKYVKGENVTPEITSGNYIVSLDRPEPVTATITAAGYATFANAQAVDFSAAEGLTVLTAQYNKDTDKIDYTVVTSKKVPAGKAVVLKGAEGEYNGTVIASADELVNNGLKVNLTENTPATGKEYCLANKNGVVGFYKVATTTYVKAGKAYLEIERTGSTGAKDFYAIEDETDGINAINNSHQTVESVYNLSGQRVNKAQKGIYIVNGKKVVIR